jgi:hypothetical protein
MLVSSNLPAHIPRAILKCSAVSREINFSSAEEITQFRLEQRIFLDGSCIEGVCTQAKPLRTRLTLQSLTVSLCSFKNGCFRLVS